MKISLRKDLGGYATSLASLGHIDGVEITKPFVLIAGENGSGKSSLLNMIRSAIGLTGHRAGRLPEMQRLIEPNQANGDLGKLASFTSSLSHENQLPEDHPGVVDVRALSWAGHRTFLFDSRAAGKLLNSGSFDADMMHHVNFMFGAKRASHGQALGQGWEEAIRWAAGSIDLDDIYDDTRLSGNRLELFRALCAGKRPAERWLFLDEPETAIDIGRLFTGLATFVELAAPGKLRVFCASHSPLFAAGFAEHRNVQVLDLGGPKPWLDVQQRAMAFSRDQEKIEQTAAGIVAQIQLGDHQARVRAEQERKKQLEKSITRLTKPQLRSLARIGQAESQVVNLDGVPRKEILTFDSLESRGLVKRTYSRQYVLTDLGRAAIEQLTAEDLLHPE